VLAAALPGIASEDGSSCIAQPAVSDSSAATAANHQFFFI
jgi:hypothetical protein